MSVSVGGTALSFLVFILKITLSLEVGQVNETLTFLETLVSINIVVGCLYCKVSLKIQSIY